MNRDDLSPLELRTRGLKRVGIVAVICALVFVNDFFTDSRSCERQNAIRRPLKGFLVDAARSREALAVQQTKDGPRQDLAGAAINVKAATDYRKRNSHIKILDCGAPWPETG